MSIQTDAIDAYYAHQKTNEGILTPAEKTERVIQRLEAEVERLRAELRKVQDMAYDGQNYDAMHAFNVLLSIHTLTMTALRGEGEK